MRFKSLCFFIFYSFILMGQNKSDSLQSFIQIDSIYLQGKNRLSINLTRFTPNNSFSMFISPRDYTLVESGSEKPLVIQAVDFINDKKKIVIYYNAASNQPVVQKLIKDILDELEDKNKSINKKITWQVTLLGDSSNHYKWKTFNVSKKTLKKTDESFSDHYVFNRSELHKNNFENIENAVFLALCDNGNIINLAATLNSILTHFSDSIKVLGNQPAIVPFIFDNSPTPDDLVNYLQSNKKSQNRIINSKFNTRLSNIIDELKSLFPYKLQMKFEPIRPVYAGETRTLTISSTEKLDKSNKQKISDSDDYSLGTSDWPYNIKDTGISFWLICIFTGLLLIALLFFVWSIWFPLQEDKKFFKKYVKKYEPLPNIVKYDTLTNEPIEKGSLVVTRCAEIIPYYIWLGIGNQCPNYPDCMDYLKCEGNGRNDTKYKFFSQAGPLKKYNWSFYGAIGGFLAWINAQLFILIANTFELDRIFLSFYSIHPDLKLNAGHFAQNCVNQAGVGFGIGIGLGLALVVADYFSSIIRPKIYLPILKITLCGIAGACLFLGMYVLSYHFRINNYITGLITWLIFGLILATTLSIKSTNVSFKRAIKSVGIGILISYVIFNLVTILININYTGFSTNSFRPLLLELFKIIRMMVMGALTGWFATASLEKSEDYELEILAPDNVRGRKIPLSKIIKSGIPITIGSSPKNVIFIKWTDPGAEEVHAKLDYDNSKVVLTSTAEIIINKEYLSKGSKHILQGGDTIQLGRHSVTLLKFNIKEI